MTIEYQCPVCRGITYLGDEEEGTLAKCSRCQLKFIAPTPGAEIPLAESSTSSLFDSQATDVFESSPIPESVLFEAPPSSPKSTDPFSGQVPGFEDRDAFRTASGRFTPLRESKTNKRGTPFQRLIPDPRADFSGMAPPPIAPPSPLPPPPQRPPLMPSQGTSSLLSLNSAQAPNPFAAPIPELATQNIQLDRPPSLDPPARKGGNKPFPAPVPEVQAQRNRNAGSMGRSKTKELSPNPFAAPVPENKPQPAPRPVKPVPEPVRKAPVKKDYSLIVVEGLVEQIFRFQQGSSYVVGRDVAAGIKVMSKSVSRRHARIETTGPTPVLIDLGSANGTQVNGTKVSRLVLRDGDLIKIGQVILRFQNES
jgi:hypothetical protein